MTSRSRPVDGFRPSGFRFDRITALNLGCCTRCGCDVTLIRLSDIDAREYAISALCPQCYFDITGPEDEEPDFVALVDYPEKA